MTRDSVSGCSTERRQNGLLQVPRVVIVTRQDNILHRAVIAVNLALGPRTASYFSHNAIDLEPRCFDVLYDHEGTSDDSAARVSRTVSWFGNEYKSGALLAFLYIAIVSRDMNRNYHKGEWIRW